MSGMANEMEARIREEGALDLDPAPGTAGGDAATTAANPSEETSNTATATDRDSQTIPYARFKEVNDRLSEFKELEDFGYGADSLRRLVSFEAQYLQDPKGTVRGLVDNLDFPQEVKDAISNHIENGISSGRGEGESSVNSAAVLSPEDKERLEYIDQVRERDEDTARQQQLDRVLGAWDGMDKEESFEVKGDPQVYERAKLNAITAAAASGRQFKSVDELAKAARDELMGFRTAILGDAIQRTSNGESPKALPGGGPGSAVKTSFGVDIRAATKAAQAAIERGELPKLGE